MALGRKRTRTDLTGSYHRDSHHMMDSGGRWDRGKKLKNWIKYEAKRIRRQQDKAATKER